jgi:hypothetical protein
MIYKIVSPFSYEIEGDSYTTAIKDFIKLNHDLRIQQMIFKDRQKYMMANMNYYQQNQRNKVGIDTYPLNYIPIISKNMPYNMFLKIIKNKPEEDSKKEEDAKKELAYKMVVPTPLPSMFPNDGRTPLVPVVYNVYKNNDTDTDKHQVKYITQSPFMQPPFMQPPYMQPPYMQPPFMPPYP